MNESPSLPDDRYIPVRIEALMAEIAGDHGRFAEAAKMIEALELAFEYAVRQETAAFRRMVSRRYEPFNPARETIAHGEDPEDEERIASLRGMVTYLLDKANYEPLEEGQLEETLHLASTHGMSIRVNPDRVAFLDLSVRGRSQTTRMVRTWRHPFTGEERSIEIFRRLAVVFRPSDEARVSLKLFREIPLEDVEALLPHAEPQMTRLDKLKIVGGGLGALGGIATKLWAVLINGAAIASGFMWAATAAMVGLSIRSILGYRHAKKVRSSQMTHHLYFQNVANNAGVLDQLLASIGHEELKEALIGYAVVSSDDTIVDMASFEAAAEAWLKEAFGVRVDFDGVDAHESLTRLELWADAEAWTLVAPAEAIERLDRRWRARKGAGYHVRAWREHCST
ncbi:MAG: DUF3754 domain-containing protein [Nannocystaceae bacterium]|nr:DUF3754 domain-containing protein [Nannocystaceae bacterium]